MADREEAVTLDTSHEGMHRVTRDAAQMPPDIEQQQGDAERLSVAPRGGAWRALELPPRLPAERTVNAVLALHLFICRTHP